MRTMNRICCFVTCLSILGASVFSGCAGVSFYSDKAVKNATGIPIYAPKPFVLVVRTGNKDKPIETSIVYLSDPNNVVYAVPRSGFGSSDLSIALANGQLTAFGQKTDTKVPEIMGAVAGMLTARAGAAKTEAEAQQITRGLGEQAGESWVEIGTKLKKLAVEKSGKMKSELAGLTQSELLVVGAALQTAQIVGEKLSNPANIASAPAEVANLGKTLEPMETLATNATPKHDASVKMAASWAKELRALLPSPQSTPVAPAAPVLPDFELYEIQFNDGQVVLRRMMP